MNIAQLNSYLLDHKIVSTSRAHSEFLNGNSDMFIVTHNGFKTEFADNKLDRAFIIPQELKSIKPTIFDFMRHMVYKGFPIRKTDISSLINPSKGVGNYASIIAKVHLASKRKFAQELNIDSAISNLNAEDYASAYLFSIFNFEKNRFSDYVIVKNKDPIEEILFKGY